jgi:hypothetical protein
MLLRRRLSVFLAAAMMTLMVVVSAMPAFAGPKSQNSCGASNPNIEVPPGQGNRGDEFEDCGVRNNPNFEEGEFPPGFFPEE